MGHETGNLEKGRRNPKGEVKKGKERNEMHVTWKKWGCGGADRK